MPPAPRSDLPCGGLDLGGTKIEARLFSPGLDLLDSRRIPTPTGGLDALLEAVADQLHWLEAASGQGAALPVGMGLPGVIDTGGGPAFAANLPVGGHDLPGALRQRLGRALPLLNDAQAFALSEARGGAGDGAERVAGLIMGTGIGAGLAVLGRALPQIQLAALEVGHLGWPARLGDALPLLACGCGRSGCFETLLSGPGLSRLAEHRLGVAVPPEDLAQRASHDPAAEAVLTLWADLAAELLLTLHLAQDPQVIVLGGGLTRLPGLLDRLAAALAPLRLGPLPLPRLALAVFGDASGARGAAIHARDLAPC
ncbi:ROK family protein [Salipiger marinus]|uniref:N-acetylglucosamine kinase n=1 Tax=Salipiger marinus TaxID=555512 RepID=A0A1G8LJ85_9RHOB|nr:ROK family protein [Salipiger marinus]SDI55736.1 N-acetylglucosamine kinase [Salipiger marinus]